jgi:hypothetical protein
MSRKNQRGWEHRKQEERESKPMMKKLLTKTYEPWRRQGEVYQERRRTGKGQRRVNMENRKEMAK